MKKFFVLFVLFLFVGAAQNTFGQRDRTGKNRYEGVTNAIYTQDRYSGPDTLEGLGKKTAEELGLTGKKVWNEYPNGPRIVVLHAHAIIYYDTASLEPLYLDGCRIKGKSFFNRIKLVEEEIVVEKELVVEKKVEVKVPGPCVPGQPVTSKQIIDGKNAIVTSNGCNTTVMFEAEVVNPCPSGLDIDSGVTKMGRFKQAVYGDVIQKVISVGGSGGISAIRGDRGTDLLWDAGFSYAMQGGQQAINADHNYVKVSADDLKKPVKVKKGDTTPLPNGLVPQWNGNRVKLFRGGVQCSAGRMKSASNLGIWSSESDDADGEKTTPRSGSPVPIRPRGTFIGPPIQGGRITGNTNSIPTRPTGGGNSLTTGGNTQQQQNTTCRGDSVWNPERGGCIKRGWQ